MLKLIGTHCTALQYLDISNSKQVSDMGIESLCFQVQIRDKRGGTGSDPSGSPSDETGVIQIVEEATPLTLTVSPASTAAASATSSSNSASNPAGSSNTGSFVTYHRKVDHSSMPVRMREEDFSSEGGSGDSAIGKNKD